VGLAEAALAGVPEAAVAERLAAATVAEAEAVAALAAVRIAQ
jgi:hypothetical protein